MKANHRYHGQDRIPEGMFEYDRPFADTLCTGSADVISAQNVKHAGSGEPAVLTQVNEPQREHRDNQMVHHVNSIGQ